MSAYTSHNRSLLAGLSTAFVASRRATPTYGAEIRTEPMVDIERFMGDWYVIASVPTFIDKEAHNAMERYELDYDGTIKTTFSFRKGGFEGKQKRYNPRGFVLDTESNAVWGMQFVWPIKSDYRVVYVDEEYSQTIIGRNKRDLVWIMARTPSISNEDFFRHAQTIREQGYDTSKLKLVPQRWDTVRGDLGTPRQLR